MFELRPYQVECLNAMRRASANGVTRQLVVMATGLGKTIVIASWLKHMGWPNVFAIMHREELIQQAADKIGMVADDPSRMPRIEIEKAERWADEKRGQIILGSVQTLGRGDGERLERFPRDWPQAFWIDEVHHAPAKTYLNVLDYFWLYGKQPRRGCYLVGTTATPDRLDKLGYDNLFDDVVFRYGLKEGIRDGWLADIRAWAIEAGIDLSKVRTRQGDFVDKDLEAAVNVDEVNAVAVETWKRHCSEIRSLFFCVTKQHARDVGEVLRRAGAKAAVVLDETPAAERRAAISLFRSGEINALVNVGVFTEGFDVPEIEAVHVLRPTQSRALYTQMIGRGTRRTESKKSVQLFDYYHQGHNVCSIGQIFGLPDSWVLKNTDVGKEADELKKLEEDLGMSLDGIESLDQVRQKLRIKEERLALIRGSLVDWSLPSNLVWLRPSSAEERYMIAWRNETREKLETLARKWDMSLAREILERNGLYGTTERIELSLNELGQWEATLHQRLTWGSRPMQTRIAQDKSLTRIVRAAENWIEDERAHKVRLLKKNARWASEPASDAQIEVLRRKGVPEYVLAEQLTKREAGILIDMPNERIRSLFAE